MIAKIFVFIFGSSIGSFLNVCIHRMPQKESIVWPSSHCPKCKARIPAYDNIPFISYILLGGKCRFCKKAISLRYPIVELLTASLFVALFSRFGLTYDFFIYIFFVSALIAASFIDIDHRLIPDELSVGGMILGFILVAVKGVSLKPLVFSFRPMFLSFLGIIVGGGIIYLTGFLFDLVYFKLLKRPPIEGETESMGGGDVKLLAMIGAFLGWKQAILTFFIAPFVALVFGLVNLVKKKQHTLPYGPFLSMAAIVSLFWAEQIIRLLIR
jgi:leader peptidase (prepilin peptidase)/N-methyltransferase